METRVIIEEMNGGVLNMVFNAGPVVILVMLILLIFSILSWAIIIYKYKTFRKIDKESQRFLSLFNKKPQSIPLLYETSMRYGHTPFAKLYKVAHEERTRAERYNNIIDRLQRMLKKTILAEMNTLEKSLPFLATAGSATPFLGLFGTVWGLMRSFKEIGVTGSANFAVVAPGISEALITTAMGLVVAIPAVIAYNHFTTKLNHLIHDVEVFSEEVLWMEAPRTVSYTKPVKDVRQPG
ncbi:MAG: MotA/TolQ/ExbB proton channel family protein [Thermodesulfobacteriota bacterium]